MEQACFKGLLSARHNKLVFSFPFITILGTNGYKISPIYRWGN